MKDLEITSVTLESVMRAVDILAKKINAPANLLPTYGKSEEFARPHVETNANGYHWVVVERGTEFERRTTWDPDELLYWIFESVTFSMAVKYELQHRVSGKDPRRMFFRKQEELLGILDKSWEKRSQQEHLKILGEHPFSDNRPIF
jgi:hypothetical protein